MTQLSSTTKPEFLWRSASLTDKGNVRQYNEDSFIARDDASLWAVADGMGGHEAGDVASQLIVELLSKINPHTNLSTYVDIVDDTLIEANNQLRTLSREKYNNHTIGSTVVCMIASDRHIAYLWAGDSRIYRIRNRQIKQLTRDHSEVQNMVDQGLLLAEEAEAHPAANVITRAMGAADALYLSVGIEETLDKDIYILCSDGLYRDITERELLKMALQPDINNICSDMMQLALSREAKDNITTIILQSTINGEANNDVNSKVNSSTNNANNTSNSIINSD
ncbi:MAG: protein phosphatase 2C domain-containing protein [Gammaproteobacteria bacterium]|nr:protein phosphatase 2C domain-containing protein [Gammaproteobacteria bacterium]